MVVTFVTGLDSVKQERQHGSTREESLRVELSGRTETRRKTWVAPGARNHVPPSSNAHS